MRQSEARGEWRTGFEASIACARRAAGNLSPVQLSWRPPSGGWGVGNVLDHLSHTNERYCSEIEAAIGSAHPLENADAAWRPSLLGWMLARALTSRHKARAPRAFMPAPVVSDDPLHGFSDSVRRLISLLDGAERADLAKTRIRSPAARSLRLNLGDGFRLQVLHAERHFGQIERIVERLEFPR